MNDTSFRSRRRLLAGLTTGIGVCLAGCLESGAEPAGDDTQPAESDHPFAEFVDHDGEDPIEFQDEHMCPVCGMRPEPNWRSQLAHDDGRGAVFDTPGCLFAYVAEPPTDSPIEAAWTTAFEGRDLIDATEASFVLVTDESAVSGEHMGLNPRPFADYDDAVDYLDEWDAEALTEDDIIDLEDVTREDAELYRESHLAQV